MDRDRPALSVVIGAQASGAALTSCLSALEPQRDGAEVLVCEPRAADADLRSRFEWATFVDVPGELVPGLWREGIDRSSGDVVALTISAMVPADDWLERIRAVHRRHDAVSGAIEPHAGLRLSDWGEYLCRYSHDMLPFEEQEKADLPADNASYKRDLLERTRELYRDGFWEPVVHRRLRDEGVALWSTPEVVVRQGRSAGARAFVHQRLEHGRAHGRQRGVGFGRLRNVAGVLGSPLVPVLITARIAREVLSRRRLRLRALLALPHILLFNAAWAVGEAHGHLDVLTGRA